MLGLSEDGEVAVKPKRIHTVVDSTGISGPEIGRGREVTHKTAGGGQEDGRHTLAAGFAGEERLTVGEGSAKSGDEDQGRNARSHVSALHWGFRLMLAPTQRARPRTSNSPPNTPIQNALAGV
jgi:hypothetical protein